MKKILVIFTLFGSVGLLASNLVGPDWTIVNEVGTNHVTVIDDGFHDCVQWINAYEDGSFDTFYFGDC